jgi:hypothetical protein
MIIGILNIKSPSYQNKAITYEEKMLLYPPNLILAINVIIFSVVLSGLFRRRIIMEFVIFTFFHK